MQSLTEEEKRVHVKLCEHEIIYGADVDTKENYTLQALVEKGYATYSFWHNCWHPL